MQKSIFEWCEEADEEMPAAVLAIESPDPNESCLKKEQVMAAWLKLSADERSYGAIAAFCSQLKINIRTFARWRAEAKQPKPAKEYDMTCTTLKQWRDPLIKADPAEGNPSERPEKLTIGVLIAEGGSFKWKGPLRALVDSGSTQCTIPRELLREIGLEGVKVVDKGIASLANGSTEKADLIYLDVVVQTNPHAEPIAISGVPFFVMGGGTEMLLGMSLLYFYDYLISGNTFQYIHPNEDRLKQLPHHDE